MSIFIAVVLAILVANTLWLFGFMKALTLKPIVKKFAEWTATMAGMLTTETEEFVEKEKEP